MKKTIILLVVTMLSSHVFAQENTDESKPTAAVAVVKAISDSFLPGVFEGIKGVLDNVEAKKKHKEELDKAKTELTELKSKSEKLRETAVTTLDDLKDYYDAESKDFSTINEFYLKVSIFSTKVHMLVGISDIITNPKVSFGSDDAKIVVINRFKDAAREVVSNFSIDEDKFISDNKTLNADVLNQKRTIDAVITRMKGSGLTETNTNTMSTAQINNYFALVASIKNEGAHQFSDMEQSVLQIQTLLGSYLKDFSKKTNKINESIEKTVVGMKD